MGDRGGVEAMRRSDHGGVLHSTSIYGVRLGGSAVDRRGVIEISLTV